MKSEAEPMMARAVGYAAIFFLWDVAFCTVAFEVAFAEDSMDVGCIVAASSFDLAQWEERCVNGADHLKQCVVNEGRKA